MIKKAVVTIKSRNSQNIEELIEVSTPCKFFINSNSLKIQYEETEISGMNGTDTTIIIKDKYFELIRTGNMETKMRFEANKEDICLYKTQYGILEIESYTKQLSINMSENGGNITTEYILLVEGQESIKNYLTIDVKINN